MELRNINTFLHIAELHSFSRTARQLGYSQSAVSSQIAQLEAELGAPLFDRVGKTVRLTDAGQTFLGYARTLLATAQQAQAALQPARQISGSLRIALADSVCSTFLPGLLKRYHALCPQVELVLCTATATGCCRCWAQIRSIWPIRWTSPCCSPIWCLRRMCRSRCVLLHRRLTRLPGRKLLRWKSCPGRNFCSLSAA